MFCSSDKVIHCWQRARQLADDYNASSENSGQDVPVGAVSEKDLLEGPYTCYICSASSDDEYMDTPPINQAAAMKLVSFALDSAEEGLEAIVPTELAQKVKQRVTVAPRIFIAEKSYVNDCLLIFWLVVAVLAAVTGVIAYVLYDLRQSTPMPPHKQTVWKLYRREY